MLKLDGANTSCCYQLCTPMGGHSTCQVVADHYQRLCEAARALLDRLDTADRDELAQCLRAVLDETTGVER